MLQDLLKLDLAGVVELFSLFEQKLDLSHVLIGFLELASGFLALLFEAADSGCLLEDITPVFRLHQKDLVDLSLLKNAVCGLSDTCVHEKLADVSQKNLFTVDVVLVVTVSECTAFDLDLCGIDIQLALLIVQCENDLAHLHGLSGICSVEDDIVLLACTDGAQRLRAQNPFDRVDDVALSASVWTEKRGDSVRELELCSVSEGFETV